MTRGRATPANLSALGKQRFGRVAQFRTVRAFTRELAGVTADDFSTPHLRPRGQASRLRKNDAADVAGVVTDAYAAGAELRVCVDGTLLAIRSPRNPAVLARRLRTFLSDRHVEVVDVRRGFLAWRVTFAATRYGGDEQVAALVTRARTIGVWR